MAMRFRRALVPVLAVMALGAGGCAIIEHESHTGYSGRYIDTSEYEAIRVGATTSDDLMSRFGPPSAKDVDPDGAEVWRWAYTRTRSGEGSLLLVFHGEGSKRTEGQTWVELREGVVSKKGRT